MDANADLELLNWVEQAALENMRAHIKSGDDIKRESNIALTVIIAGASSALAYAVNVIGSPLDIDVLWGVSVLSGYLFLLCAVLVFKCLRVGAFPAPTNEPTNLYKSDYPLQEIRECELKNMQGRIEDAERINQTTSKWLNRVWAATTLSPVIFAVTFFLSCRGYLS